MSSRLKKSRCSTRERRYKNLWESGLMYGPNFRMCEDKFAIPTFQTPEFVGSRGLGVRMQMPLASLDRSERKRRDGSCILLLLIACSISRFVICRFSSTRSRLLISWPRRRLRRHLQKVDGHGTRIKTPRSRRSRALCDLRCLTERLSTANGLKICHHYFARMLECSA